MAKFPYIVSASVVTNADQTISLTWQLSTASSVAVHGDTVNFPPQTAATEVLNTLLQAAKNSVLSDLAVADLPTNFSFSINETDLI
jgi:hypothetical protein